MEVAGEEMMRIQMNQIQMENQYLGGKKGNEGRGGRMRRKRRGRKERGVRVAQGRSAGWDRGFTVAVAHLSGAHHPVAPPASAHQWRQKQPAGWHLSDNSVIPVWHVSWHI